MIIKTTQIRFEPLTIAHLDRVAAMEAETFDVPWGRDILQKELAQELSYYVAAVDGDGAVVGYGGFQRIEEEAEILRLLVQKESRRTGVGTLILRELIASLAKLQTKQIFLEVEENNTAARALYRKMGFTELSVRKNYYGSHRNAIIMRCLLEKNWSG